MPDGGRAGLAPALTGRRRGFATPLFLPRMGEHAALAVISLIEHIAPMNSSPSKALRRWQLIVDCVLYFGIAAVVTLFIGGLGDCATAPDAAAVAACDAFMRGKLVAIVIGACLIFPFWLRRKLRRGKGS